MFGGDLKIGRLAGIPISIHPLWLVIVALITWSLGSTYYPDEVSGIAPAAAYGLGLASALLLFASILLHELGHAVVARRYGVEIEGIELWLLGGVAKMKGAAHRPEEELRFALAGPGVTVVIAVVFGLATVALPSSTPDAVIALLGYQALINAAILVFNMLPAFPLDGGRVLRAIIWQRTGNFEQATARAARVGRGFGYGMVGLAFLGVFAGAPGLLWLGLIGLFLIVAGRAEESSVALQATFKGLGLRRVMAVPAATLDADTTWRTPCAIRFPRSVITPFRWSTAESRWVFSPSTRSKRSPPSAGRGAASATSPTAIPPSSSMRTSRSNSCLPTPPSSGIGVPSSAATMAKSGSFPRRRSSAQCVPGGCSTIQSPSYRSDRNGLPELMDLGYSGSLYILAFDHRGSFTKRFGVEGDPTAEDNQRFADGKHLIFEGIEAALARGADPSVTGALVDEQFGGPTEVPQQAKARGIKLAMPVEKSGQKEFDFEYGDDFGAHIERYDPDFSKVLVRYNPDGDCGDEPAAGRAPATPLGLAARERSQVPLRVAGAGGGGPARLGGRRLRSLRRRAAPRPDDPHDP